MDPVPLALHVDSNEETRRLAFTYARRADAGDAEQAILLFTWREARWLAYLILELTEPEPLP